jgi:hypothetical protein
MKAMFYAQVKTAALIAASVLAVGSSLFSVE